MRLIDADALSARLYHEAFETDTDMQKWDSGCWIRYKMFECAIDEAPTIEPKQGEWILCSERLPEEDGHYIVYAPSYSGGSSSGKEIHNGVMFSRFKSGKWSIEVGYHKRPNCVKAWMPIEPWEGADDEA